MNMKNLIVFIAEGMPADAISALGRPGVKTPNLDRLAGQSVAFPNAYCTQPVCTPARASIFTGRYPHETCRDNEHNLAPDIPCFPELSDFSDYRTAMIGKWDLGDEVFAQHGFETWRSIDASRHAHYSPGRDRSRETSYAGFLRSHGYEPDVPLSNRGNNPHSWFNHPVQIPEKFSPDAFAAQEAIEFIRDAANSPFMLWMPFLRCKPGPFDNSDKIHDPADMQLPDNTFHDMAHDCDRHPKSRLLAFHYRNRSPDQWKRTIADYFNKITLIDRYVGNVLDELNRQGKAEETAIVFTGDHGFMLGEHGMSKKSVMTEESVKVPLMFCIPGVTDAGRVIESPFGHIDLVPTLLEAMGREVPDSLPGQSWFDGLKYPEKELPNKDVFIEWNGPGPKGVFKRLWNHITEDIGPYWKGPDLVDMARVWTDPVRTIITADGWKYSHSPLGFHELFNLKKDPHELHNLAVKKEMSATVSELKDKLFRWKEAAADHQPVKNWPEEKDFVGTDADADLPLT